MARFLTTVWLASLERICRCAPPLDRALAGELFARYVIRRPRADFAFRLQSLDPPVVLFWFSPPFDHSRALANGFAAQRPANATVSAQRTLLDRHLEGVSHCYYRHPDAVRGEPLRHAAWLHVDERAGRGGLIVP